MLNKMPINPSKLAESLNELLVDFCTFAIDENSPINYFDLPVKVISWERAYYDGSQGKGLLTFSIGDEIFSAAIEYSSWGNFDPKDIENSLSTDCSVYPDTLKTAVADADPKIFAEQMDAWREEHKKECERDILHDAGWIEMMEKKNNENT